MIRFTTTTLLFFLVAAVGYAAAVAEKEHCQFIPLSFSVVMDPLKIDTKNNNQVKSYSMVDLYYDYPMQRMRLDVFGFDFEEEKKLHTTLWIHFKEKNNGQVLRLDRETNECYTNTTNRKMEKPGIPKGSKFLTTLQRGSTITEMWKISHGHQELLCSAGNNNKNQTTATIGEFEQGSCIPVGLTIFEKEDQDIGDDYHDFSKFRPLFFVSFINFHSGVNENLFDVPVACAKYPQFARTGDPPVVDEMLSMLEVLFG